MNRCSTHLNRCSFYIHAVKACTHERTDTHARRHKLSLSYLQSVGYLWQVGDPWLLVNKLSFVQVSKLGPIKPHSEICPKHPLMALGRDKHVKATCNIIHKKE